MGVGDAGVVGIVGAGVMGAGIAQVALEAGYPVRLYDVDAAAIDAARTRIREGLARRAAKLGLDAETIDDWVDGRTDRLTPLDSLDAAADADLVIECAIEDLAAKRAIVATLDRVARPDTVIATNTSALSVNEIATAATRRDRVLGLHFFNPAPVMALVEVVAPPATDPAVADRATAWVTAWGKTPVRVADAPGFIVNRVNRPFTIEALRLLEGGAAGVEAIDEAMRAGDYPMGPFELIDLAGLDVNLAAARSIWDRLGRPDRLRPSPIQERLVADGQLGRKRGIGFYVYEGGRRGRVAPSFADAPSTVDEATIRSRIEAAILEEARHAADEGVAPAADIDLAMRLGAAHPMGPFERRRAAHGTMRP